MLVGAFSSESLFRQLHASEMEDLNQKYAGITPYSLAENEDYWAQIQQGYPASSSPVLNLNNGGVSPSPLVVMQAVERFNQLSNHYTQNQNHPCNPCHQLGGSDHACSKNMQNGP